MSDAPDSGSRSASPLEIPRAICEAMIAHCRAESPLECCGLLGGRSARVSAIFPLPNIADRGETRYEADPVAVIDAARSLREGVNEILAIYHSHPRWRAIPSRTDLELNHWGEMPHIIVSLLADPPEVRAWRLDRASYEELRWTLVESDGSDPAEPPPQGDSAPSSVFC